MARQLDFNFIFSRYHLFQVSDIDMNKEEDMMQPDESERVETVVDLHGQPVDLSDKSNAYNFLPEDAQS